MKLSGREKYLIIIALFLSGAFIWEYKYGRFSTLETEHYIIESAASEDQTAKIGQILGITYLAYIDFFKDDFALASNHPRLKIKLYRDRTDLRKSAVFSSWAEAFYKKPYCHAYYAYNESNPYHWMIHEAIHQLNEELAALKLPRWIDEGIAEYFATSKIQDGKLLLGSIDKNTYPIWWLDSLKLSGNIEKDIKDKKFIPLETILLDKYKADIDKRFNQYYIHWWSLTYFLFNYKNQKYRKPYIELIKDGGTIDNFEKNIGKLEMVQREWYFHLYNLNI